MHTILWIVQVVLGIKLLSVAYTHGLRQSQPSMRDAIQKMGRLAQPLHYVIAFLAFAGTAGLILPGILGWTPEIIPVTAIVLAALLLASIFFHMRSREKPNVFVSLVLFALAAWVAYGRWGFAP